jgi:hypothetical protein
MDKKIIRTRIKFPGKSFCVYDPEHRASVLSTLDKIATNVLKLRKYVSLDLSDCEYFSAAATLMLIAEVTRCQNVSQLDVPNQSIEIELPVNNDTRKILRQSGFWEAVKPGGEKKLNNLSKNDDIQFCTGNDPAKDMQVMEQILKSKLDLKELPPHIARAISEAFLNIMYHAYESAFLHPFMKNRWWLYCYINLDETTRKATSVVFLIYDKGVGIPKSIKNSSKLSLLQRTILRDSQLVKMAFQNGFSSSGFRDRGLGTEDLKKPLSNKDDVLLVLSNKAIVEFDKHNVSGKPEDEDTYSVGGTLLEWSLSL